jgi:hypothetical protein
VVGRDTLLRKLEAALKCRSCKKGRYAPPAHMNHAHRNTGDHALCLDTSGQGPVSSPVVITVKSRQIIGSLKLPAHRWNSVGPNRHHRNEQIRHGYASGRGNTWVKKACAQRETLAMPDLHSMATNGTASM